MALVNVTSGSGGSFNPIIKYDARAGRFFRVDKDDSGSTPTDITKVFKAVFDFEQVEVGWILFPSGGAPDFQLVPFGAALPQRPSKEHRQGVRMTVKLAAACGGDVREIAGISAAFLRGINALHDEYLLQAAANPGKLPVVTLSDTIPVESGGGAKRSTNYEPVFAIAGWAPRPADMPLKAVPAATNGAAAANGNAVAAAPTRPASPGSTRMEPPVSDAPQLRNYLTTEQAVVDNDDFG